MRTQVTLKTQLDEESVYFDSLPKGTQELVKELILEAAGDRRGPEGWKADEDAIEAIECRYRSGFSPHSFNKGGLEYNNFTDLMAYWGGGYTVSHQGAAKEIERQIATLFNWLSEDVYNEFKERLAAKGVTKEQCNYSSLRDLIDAGDTDLELVWKSIEDKETEYLGDDSNSIMHSIRFMYHGKTKGKHSASVSAAVNTEGPYHRSHISWAPNVFCEGSKEVEITWTTQRELKTKLKAALAKVSKAVF